MKTCKKCGGDGPFSSHPTTADRLNPFCVGCENERLHRYEKTPKGKAARAWSSLRARAGNSTGRTPTYAKVEVRMTREEFMAWAVPRFERWAAEHPDVRPSIDRRKNDGHYELANIRIVALSVNVQKTSRKKSPHAPRGTAWCSGPCKQFRLKKHFAKCSRLATGVQTQCRDCNREYMRTYRKAR